MECAYDPGTDAAVTLHEPNGAQVRLWNRVASDDGVIDVCVEIVTSAETNSLKATAHGVTLAVMGEDLTPFLHELAETFTGWEGTRTWRNLDRDIEIGATYASRGYVDLTWTLRSRPYAWGPNWTASVTIRVEAGEQLRTLTADMYRFLHPDAD